MSVYAPMDGGGVVPSISMSDADDDDGDDVVECTAVMAQSGGQLIERITQVVVNYREAFYLGVASWFMLIGMNQLFTAATDGLSNLQTGLVAIGISIAIFIIGHTLFGFTRKLKPSPLMATQHHQSPPPTTRTARPRSKPPPMPARPQRDPSSTAPWPRP